MVKIVPLWSLTLLKRSDTLMVHGKGGVVRPVTPPLAMLFSLFGGLEGSKISFFLGPKPTQGPMNNVFERKEFLGNFFFGTPGTPDRKNFRARPGPAGPGRRGGPKVVQIVPLGSLTLLERSGGLKNGF